MTMSQQQMLDAARQLCVCLPGMCLDESCPGCAELDPEFDCLRALHLVTETENHQ